MIGIGTGTIIIIIGHRGGEGPGVTVGGDLAPEVEVGGGTKDGVVAVVVVVEIIIPREMRITGIRGIAEIAILDVGGVIRGGGVGRGVGAVGGTGTRGGGVLGIVGVGAVPEVGGGIVRVIVMEVGGNGGVVGVGVRGGVGVMDGMDRGGVDRDLGREMIIRCHEVRWVTIKKMRISMGRLVQLSRVWLPITSHMVTSPRRLTPLLPI